MENIDAQPNNKQHPWVLFIGGENLENQEFYNVVPDRKSTGFTRSNTELLICRPGLNPTNINRWFLLELDATEFESSNQLCLWNVVTLESIYLPPVRVLGSRKYCIDYVLLTKSPDDCDCMVLLWLDDPLGILYCYINEDGSWTFEDYQEELVKYRGGYERPDDKFRPIIPCEGDSIFMISRSNVLAKIEWMKPKALIKRVSDYNRLSWRFFTPVCPTCRYNEVWVTCCRDICVIYVGYGGIKWNQILSIDIFKLDFSDMSWKRLDSCPNVAFFISGKQCFSCPIASANSSKAGNQVYIIEHDGDKEENENEDENENENENEAKILLHTYHIQQKTLKTSLIASPKDKMSKPYWILASNIQALAKVEEDYCNGENGEKEQIFSESENRVLMVYEDEKKFSIMDLHTDLLKTILSHLINPSDYLNFRATSKSFCDNFSVKEWRIIQASESDNIQRPWLVLHSSRSDGKPIFSMVDPISRNKYYVTAPETLKEGFKICYSVNGELLLSSHNFEKEGGSRLYMLFFNPITKAVVYLPKLRYLDASHFFCYSTPGYLDRCIIGIRMSTKADSKTSLFCVTTENSIEDDESSQWEEWEMDELEIENEDDMFYGQVNVNGILAGGIFYFLVAGGNIAYLSDDYTFGIHKLKEPCSRSLYEQCFLAKCDEDLLSIYLGNEWKWLRAFRFNESDMTWDEVKDLKNRNLYLSHASSITSEPQPPQVGDRIYFSRLYQDSIVYYSFNTQKFHISDGKDSLMNNYYELEDHLNSCWIEPSWELEDQ